MEAKTYLNDYELLRRFEPILRYTRGERFLPIDVERYVNQSSLWVQPPNEPPRQLVKQGELTLDKLVEPRHDGFGHRYFMKFIEPLDLVELARYSLEEAVKSITHTETHEVFKAGRGRLARVGYGSRFVDALFSITLLMRGRVPGDTAAAAAMAYQRIQAKHEKYNYYGRVSRRNGWIILQYWFFYPFNNWRSGFFGVNDHEGDWEMISIYCYDQEDQVLPHWVAYASHDFAGDDLRRRWDDQEVKKIGEHPVVYAGAGSHASYFETGEYQAELELSFLTTLARLVDRFQKFWSNTLWGEERKGFNVFRIPFVDYARGDGVSIGPGQQKEWEPCLLEPVPSWVENYRGLWGVYVRDPIAGEIAPAGPMYNRDGTVRRAWYDPLGWAGLDKVPPPDEALATLNCRQNHIKQQTIALKKAIDEKSAELSGLGIEALAISNQTHLEPVHHELRGKIRIASDELKELYRSLTIVEAKQEAFDLYETRLKQGDFGPMRAHIRRPLNPSQEIDLRLGRLAEVFSAISIGLIMIGIVLLFVFARQYILFGLAALIGMIVFIESGFRRQLIRLVTSLTVGLAMVSALILVFEFFWQIVVIGALMLGGFIMWENIRELRA